MINLQNLFKRNFNQDLVVQQIYKLKIIMNKLFKLNKKKRYLQKLNYKSKNKI